MNKLSGDIIKALRTPEVRDRLTGLGFDIVASKPEELGAFLKSEIAKWTKVIKESGARLD